MTDIVIIDGQNGEKESGIGGETEDNSDEDEDKGKLSPPEKTKWVIIWFTFAIVLAYMFVGAVIFTTFERKTALEAYEDFHEALRRLSSENDCIEEDDVAEMMRIVTTAIGEGGYSSGHPYSSQLSTGTVDETYFDHPWSVKHTYFFALTVVTTVGFGYCSPRTGLAQIFCMPYAVVGILLTWSLIGSVGQILQRLCLNRISMSLQICLKRCPKIGIVSADMTLVYHIVILMLIPPSLAYYFTQQNWTFTSSFYYIVETVTTIGFGDIRPDFSGISGFQLDLLRIFIFTYLYMCLGAVSSFVNSFREFQEELFTLISTRLSRYIKNITKRRQQMQNAEFDVRGNPHGDFC
ncbi:potassium channel subfamily K member 2-like [Lytechinus pictus]|uniref:potassium channel subfamily K member 2-like n=1 Tax=Lytechinus pictus TaxID=7653 RepID=UPI0030B9BA41